MNNKENVLRIGPLPKIKYLPAIFLTTVQTYVGKYHVQYRFEKATENWVYNRGYSQTAIVDFTTIVDDPKPLPQKEIQYMILAVPTNLLPKSFKNTCQKSLLFSNH